VVFALWAIVLGVALYRRRPRMAAVIVVTPLVALVAERVCKRLFGQSFTYHYFTDTIGALFLGTALVCLAARGAGLDRCQPRCDPRHTDG
jgi:hypothetical protein